MLRAALAHGPSPSCGLDACISAAPEHLLNAHLQTVPHQPPTPHPPHDHQRQSCQAPTPYVVLPRPPQSARTTLHQGALLWTHLLGARRHDHPLRSRPRPSAVPSELHSHPNHLLRRLGLPARTALRRSRPHHWLAAVAARHTYATPLETNTEQGATET